MADLDQEILDECLIECIEAVDKAGQDMIALEQTPDDKALIDAIFRAAHSIKGSAGFLGFNNLVSLTHAGETVLSAIRENRININHQIISLLLEFFDLVRVNLKYIQENKQEATVDFNVQIGQLLAVATGDIITSTAIEDKERVIIETDTQVTVVVENTPTICEQPVPVVTAKKKEKSIDNPLKNVQPDTEETSIRIDVKLLNDMMDMVGELVLCRNQVLQIVEKHRLDVLNGSCQYLNHVTNDLQEGMMKTRMQPISNVWRKFPRLVRDYCNSSGKRINVVMTGQETEMDKSLIEAIKDPLTHIIRNAIDHGIELPEVREKKGKSIEGTFHLSAYHENGLVVIEIKDDGKGIDPAVMKAKALEKGLITKEKAATMTDAEAVNLVFHAGFSTAEKITDMSGRGVGMDVVRTNIEKIKGVVDLQSEVNVGTVLKLKIPLTLAIIPGLCVRMKNIRFIIPQINVVEMIRHHPSIYARQVFEKVHNVYVYRLRDDLLPVVHLNALLNGESNNTALAQCQEGHVNLVVVKAGDKNFCVVVDKIDDTQEIVVKPLLRQLKSMHLYAGLSIMSDGSVAIILDIVGIANFAGIASTNYEDDNRIKLLEQQRMSQAEDIQVLLMDCYGDNTFGIPINRMKRLEKVDKCLFAYSGGQLILKRHSKILPVWDMVALLNNEPSSVYGHHEEFGETVFVVVCAEKNSNKLIGFIVDKVEDIELINYDSLQKPMRPGVHGSLVCGRKMIEILDMEYLVSECAGRIYEREAS